MKNDVRKKYLDCFFKENKLVIFIAGIAGLIGASANIFLSWLIQQIIDLVGGASSIGSIRQLTLIVICLIAYVSLSPILEALSIPRFLRRAMTNYKEYAMKKLLKKNMSSFNDESKASYISALTNDAGRIEADYLENIFNVFQLFISFAGALVLMIFYNPLLSLISIALAFLPVLISIFTGRGLVSRTIEVSEKNSKYLAEVQDILNGFSIIKPFKAEKNIFKLYKENNSELEEAKYKRNVTQKMIEFFAIMGALIAQLGVMMAGAWMAYAGYHITAGMIIAFTNLMNFVINPIRQLPDLLAKRKSSLALIDKLAEKLDRNIRDEGLDLAQNIEEGVTFENFSYAYEEGKDVIKNLSVKFEAGKSYALVGGSGSGKSTLLKLLIGTDSNYRGKMQIDGKEIKDINSRSLYSNISLIEQNVFLFNSSIKDNISLFSPVADGDLIEIMKAAGLEEFADSKSLMTPVGENGNLLSGGQKQRISIARSLLKKSSILLVDEASSSLDNVNAAKVTDSILGLKGILRLVVTHRLEKSSLERYDKICLLRDGRIAEMGTFEELMDRKEYFYSLYTLAQ